MSKSKWNYAAKEDIEEQLNKLALAAIQRIVFDETSENPDREIRFERITGVLFLLMEIDEDMSADGRENGYGTDS